MTMKDQPPAITTQSTMVSDANPRMINEGRSSTPHARRVVARRSSRLGRDRKVAGHLLDRDGTNNDQRENSKEQQPPLGADLILDGERLPIGGRFAGPGADMWKRRLGEVTNRKLNLISRHVIQG